MKSLSLLVVASLSSLFLISCTDNQPPQHELAEIKQQLTQLDKKIEQLMNEVQKSKKEKSISCAFI
ncbi:MAG: hypothetical protein L3J71_13790 [Victivallaceae bacterium]|nr:hypothetical protein [Victivallaceae bacterium]